MQTNYADNYGLNKLNANCFKFYFLLKCTVLMFESWLLFNECFVGGTSKSAHYEKISISYRFILIKIWTF